MSTYLPAYDEPEAVRRLVITPVLGGFLVEEAQHDIDEHYWQRALATNVSEIQGLVERWHDHGCLVVQPKEEA